MGPLFPPGNNKGQLLLPLILCGRIRGNNNTAQGSLCLAEKGYMWVKLRMCFVLEATVTIKISGRHLSCSNCIYTVTQHNLQLFRAKTSLSGYSLLGGKKNTDALSSKAKLRYINYLIYCL